MQYVLEVIQNAINVMDGYYCYQYCYPLYFLCDSLEDAREVGNLCLARDNVVKIDIEEIDPTDEMWDCRYTAYEHVSERFGYQYDRERFGHK